MLRLRPLRPDDEAAVRTAHAAMAAEGFTFGLRLENAATWEQYLRILADHRAGLNLPDRLVPSTFLVADVAGQVVGRVSIRHEPNDFLLAEVGHVRYCVLAAFRRRGYATEILRPALVIARSLGIDRVLVTCDDDNPGSIAAIETCGGKLGSTRPANLGSPAHRRYWID